MGNNHSQGTVTNRGDAVDQSFAANKAQLVTGNTADLPKRSFSDANTDLERQQQPMVLHKPIIRRTSSQRGYRPRSASLRRMRSIQRRRIMDSSNAKAKPPAKRSAKVEAENKKTQEERALLAACARGDLKKVEKLVDSGVDVNASDKSQMSALHYAAMHARDDVIKSLISRGAEVNTTDLKGGFTAMHWVVINAVPKSGSTDHLEGSLTSLAKAGCRVNGTDFNFATPLHIAAQKGNRDAIQVLLRLGAEPDKVDITGRNCFEVAKNEQMRTYMKTLIDKNSKKDDQQKPRHTYHVLEAPPPSVPAPLPPVPPPRLVSARKSSQEEHIYHTPEFHSPPSSPSDMRPTSVTPPPPPPRRRCQYPHYALDSNMYHVLEPIPTRKSRTPRDHSPSRRRKTRKH